jgi:hypothetical protein
LAVRADRLWAMHAHRQVGSIAVLEPAEDPNPVAAVHSGQRGRNGGGRGRPQRGRGGGGNRGRGGAGQQSAGPSGGVGTAAAPVTPAAWPGPPLVCATPTGPTATTPTAVKPLAVGETECPGAFERRRPRYVGSRNGPDFWKAFFG